MLLIAGYLGFGRGRLFLLDGWLGAINLNEQRQRIGFVTQSLVDSLLRDAPQITALQLVLTGVDGSLWPYRDYSAEQRERAYTLLAESGYAALADRPFKLLSTGQRQACLLARCVMGSAELIMLDEPCAGLDLAARERFLRQVGQLLAEQTIPNLLFVTHHPDEIPSQITHILLLRDGEIVAAGPKRSVMNDDLLTQTFGVPLKIEETKDRYWVRVII